MYLDKSSTENSSKAAVAVDCSLDGSWARPAQPQSGNVGAPLAAILKALRAPTVSRDVRLAAAASWRCSYLFAFYHRLERSNGVAL
jgi:hypothetical protein